MLYEPYFQSHYVVLDTVVVITIDMSHCMSLISPTTESEKPPTNHVYHGLAVKISGTSIG